MPEYKTYRASIYDSNWRLLEVKHDQFFSKSQAHKFYSNTEDLSGKHLVIDPIKQQDYETNQ